MITDLSLRILDIAENSIRAKASIVEISVIADAESDLLTVIVSDNGCGMSEEEVNEALSPFYTTKDLKKVGLGIPFLKEAAEMTGGNLSIASEVGKGTSVKASFVLSSVNRIPLGDMAETVGSVIMSETCPDCVYRLEVNKQSFVFDTRLIKNELSLDTLSLPQILKSVKEYIRENSQKVQQDIIL